MENLSQKQFVDSERVNSIRLALNQAYEDKSRTAIEKAAIDAQKYIDEGGDVDFQIDDALEDYDGNDAGKLADMYLLRLLRDRHCDDDEDQDYIRTGWKKEFDANYRSFLDFRKKYPNAVILFRDDEAYCAYEECADVVNKVCGCPILEWNGVKAAGFPCNALDVCLPKLVRAGHRVAICDHLENPAKVRKQVERTKQLHKEFCPEKHRKEPVQLNLFDF